MISIDGHHPDLKEFITHKSDLGITQGANMSVRMTDDFFEAVKNDDDWVMSFSRPETGEIITKKEKARDIMYLIAETNWNYAEPGLIYWDTMTKYNLMSEDPDFEYAGTNPCVTGDTLILTEFGYYPIEALVGQKVNIWNGYEWSEVVPRVTGTNQPIMQIDFSDGSSIKCTNYHKFIMSSGEDVRVEAKDLKVGDCICKTEFPVIEGSVFVDDKIMYTKGFLAGDGTIDSRGRNIIYLYGEKMNLLSHIDYDKFWDQTETSNRYCLQLDKSKYVLMADKYYVPTSYNSISSRLSWLAGYMDADGTINSSSGSISITSINKALLEEVKLMLNTLGCTGVIGICKSERTASLPDGNGGYKDYHCSTSYRLTISAFYVNKLMQLGLRTHRLQLYSTTIRESSRYPQIVNITNLGIAPVVYCITDELRHSVVFGGIRTANCGEEPLPAGGSCLLGAMNLSNYWRKNNRFAYKEFTEDVKKAVRFLNEVLDEGKPLHPLVEQRRTVSELRQIGLGFMGLGDLFIKAKIRYGSKESVELCHKIGYKMIFAALQESAELAKKYGSFDNCNPDLILKSKFFIENVDKNPYYLTTDKNDLKIMIKEYGLRNSQLLTCAPTGTTSTIFNVSGGIEPIFALKFTRTTKSIYNEDRTYEVYPNGVKYFLDQNGYKSLDEVEEFPDYLVTSRDIDWQGRIDVQAAWQKHIDASISATINLPESTTVSEVSELYMYAHDAGIKGTTVFRENCKRIAILNDSFKKKDEKEESPVSNIGEMAEEVLNAAIEGTGLSKELVLGSDNTDALSFIETLIERKANTVKDIENSEVSNSVMESNILKIKDAILTKIGKDFASLSEEERDKLNETVTVVYKYLYAIYGYSFESIIPEYIDKYLEFEPGCFTDKVHAGEKGDLEGIDEVEEGVKAIKDLFTHNFSNILTRADFSSSLHGTTYYKRVACGHIYITVNRYQGRPVEVFMQSSKSGGCSANTEALGRMASTMLRAGIDPDIVVDSVMGVKCAACSSLKGKGEPIDGLSCSDVMARVIKEEYQKYKDGVYDDEIREWVKEQPRDEILKLIGIKNDQFKVNMDFDEEDSELTEEFDKTLYYPSGIKDYHNPIPDELKLHCSDTSCPHRNECSDNHHYDGCCGPDDPGAEGTIGWDYKEHSAQENIDHNICPDCGDTLLFSEGCMKCLNCGFSKC